MKTQSAQDLSLAVGEMTQAGMDQKQVDRSLLEDFHLQRLTKESDDTGHIDTHGDVSIQGVSTGSDVNVNPPAFYFDQCTAQYYVIATYAWTTLSRFRSERPFICDNPCALSGTDGFGIAFNRNVDWVASWSMVTNGAYNSSSPCYTLSTDRAWAETGNTLGVIFEGVDHSWLSCAGANPGTTDDFDFFRGSIIYYIGNPGCGSLQAYARYTHTWSNVNITGVSIGPLSVGFEWSSSTERWAKVSDPSSPINPC